MRIVVLLCGVALAAAGCGTDGSGDAPRSTQPPLVGPVAPFGTVPPDAHSGPNPPPVNSFDMPGSVTCTVGSRTTVKATYTTDKAMTVTFRVDANQVEGYPPKSGSYDVPLPCDGNSHTVEMWVVGSDMSTNTRSRTVRTGAGA